MGEKLSQTSSETGTEAKRVAYKTFEAVIPMRWADMDEFAHVNNAVYMTYMEQARFVWFEQCDMLDRVDGCAPILAHVSCDFIKPLIYPGEVLVRQSITRVGRSSIELDIEILRVDQPDFISARGRAVVVWIDYKSGQSVPWSEAQRAAFSLS